MARQLQRQQAAHRQPDDGDAPPADARPQRGERRLGRAIPVVPGRGGERLCRIGVPGELHAVDGEAAPGQVLAEEPHLERRAGKAVDEKDSTLAGSPGAGAGAVAVAVEEKAEDSLCVTRATGVHRIRFPDVASR